MIEDSYNIIHEASADIQRWHLDEIAFTKAAKEYILTAEYWRKYGNRVTFTFAFPLVVSEFEKFRDTFNRLSNSNAPESQINEHSRELLKQKCYYGMLETAQSLNVLLNLGKSEELTTQGEGYKKAILERDEQIQQLEREKSDMASTLNAVKLDYERLKKRITSDMGELGEKYIREAITTSDANAWDSTDIIPDPKDANNHE